MKSDFMGNYTRRAIENGTSAGVGREKICSFLAWIATSLYKMLILKPAADCCFSNSLPRQCYATQFKIEIEFRKILEPVSTF